MSPRFPDALAIQQWLRERNAQIMINASGITGGKIIVSGGGCAPVFIGNELVGAYGISGGTSDQDEVIGRYARETLGWAPVNAHDDTSQEVKDHVNEIHARVGLGPRKL